MKTYIVILNYNGWSDTQECLESILKLDYSNYQIIVVDNHSTNQSMDHLLAWANGRETATVDNPALVYLSTPATNKPLDFLLYNTPVTLQSELLEQESRLYNPLVFIQSLTNGGFAAGNNIGIDYAIAKGDADYIWFLNNDTVILPSSLTDLVNQACFYQKKQRKVGIIGSKLLYYHKPTFLQGVGGVYNKWLATSRHIGVFEEDLGQYDTEDVVSKIDYLPGCSLFVCMDFINDVGLMCESYFLYFEELDWALRGKHKGWCLGYCWQAKVYHKEGASIGSSAKGLNKSKLSDFYELRNRIRFTKKNFPEKIGFVRLGFLVVLFNRLRRKQFDRLGLVFRAFMGCDRP